MEWPQDGYVTAPPDLHPDKLPTHWEEQRLSAQRKSQMLARALEANKVSWETYHWVRTCFNVVETKDKIINKLKAKEKHLQQLLSDSVQNTWQLNRTLISKRKLMILLEKQIKKLKSNNEKLAQDSRRAWSNMGSAQTSKEEKGKFATEFKAEKEEEKQQLAEKEKFVAKPKAKTA